ncbi:MAG: polysaccharide biosynthesis protein [candidate division WOR-3 bacterium]|nr:MAG: polysaccharide biosynthesis protein [candidate division WOR-3 bacterium]
MPTKGRRVLVTGGTGSLGGALVHRMLVDDSLLPETITVFSRGEARQDEMRHRYLDAAFNRDSELRARGSRVLRFRIGDTRDYSAVTQSVREADIVIHAAGLKQVPTCEEHPLEAVLTNVLGANNIIRAVLEQDAVPEVVVAISTDKACEPVNAMGMSKALMERLFVAASTRAVRTRLACVRYGNVLASRGSVIPLFRKQIANGGPVTLTDREMTRFLVPMATAVNAVLATIEQARPGETFVPMSPSSRIADIASLMVGDRSIEVMATGTRPGEKVHETLISLEESRRTAKRADYLVILPPSAARPPQREHAAPVGPVTSNDRPLAVGELEAYLRNNEILTDTESPI